MSGSIQLFDKHERVGLSGFHRDFRSEELGFGTLSEVMAPYDENNLQEGIAEFHVVFVSIRPDPPITIQVPLEGTSGQALGVLADETKSRKVIERGVKRFKLFYGAA